MIWLGEEAKALLKQLEKLFKNLVIRITDFQNDWDRCDPIWRFCWQDRRGRWYETQISHYDGVYFIVNWGDALFAKYGVMTARELESRHEIFLEEYAKKVRIEGMCARDIASEMVFPAVKAEYLETIQAFRQAENVGVSSGTSALRENAVELGSGLDALKAGIRKLDEALAAGTNSAEADILSAMQALRTTVDTLEKRVAAARWPLPKYRDMLFLY